MRTITPPFRVVHPGMGTWSENHYDIRSARHDRLVAAVMWGDDPELRVFDSVGNDVTFRDEVKA